MNSAPPHCFIAITCLSQKLIVTITVVTSNLALDLMQNKIKKISLRLKILHGCSNSLVAFGSCGLTDGTIYTPTLIKPTCAKFVVVVTC